MEDDRFICQEKKGILYQVGYSDRSWFEEISMVYKKRESTGFLPGKKYEVEIENELTNGHGILTRTDEGTYIGQFVNGLREGMGTFKYWWLAKRHGYVLEFHWKDDICHDQIIITYTIGSKYKGEWIDGEA